MRLLLVTLVVLGAAALVLPVRAMAVDVDDDLEARARSACLGGKAELRLRIDVDDSDDGEEEESGDGEEGATIAVDLRVNVPQKVGTWRVVLLHERQLVYKGRGRSTSSGYAYRLRRTIPNWPGQESVTARLTAPSGRVCQVRATI